MTTETLEDGEIQLNLPPIDETPSPTPSATPRRLRDSHGRFIKDKNKDKQSNNNTNVNSSLNSNLDTNGNENENENDLQGQVQSTSMFCHIVSV